ncbi:MAG: hypothetical protein LBJ01_05650, partial [Tannerella sp.]|nr:hypothetical protein [Tannerella sp.]
MIKKLYAMNVSGKKILPMFLFVLSAALSQAQHKETYNWYFGEYAGMTWNTTQTIGSLSGLPTPLAGSKMNFFEGCITVSDKFGQLLFYSDGLTIWNRNHDVMTNGLTGDNTGLASQSAVVFPHPGKANQYIVLTIGMNRDNRLNYTVVDMTLNGGLGGVMLKNTPLTGAVGVLGESVAAVRHANGTDYWIVAPGKGLEPYSAMNVWRVTPTGVQTTLYRSDPLAAKTDPTIGSNGYLRFSLDGKYFAWMESHWITNPLNDPQFDCNFFFGKFDPNTGVFSNMKAFGYPSGMYGYGNEFSPSGEILYVPVHNSNWTINTMHVYRFEELLASSNPVGMPHREIKDKAIVPEGHVQAMQIGPEGRIYGVLTNTMKCTFMLVIDNADDYENFTWTKVGGLIPPEPALIRYGLPSFPAEWLLPLFPVARPDSAIAISGSTCVIDVLANDSLGDCTHSSVTLSVSPAASGAISAFDADNNLLYEPPAGFAGQDSLTYTFVCGTFSRTAKVYIMVYDGPDNIVDPENCLVEAPSFTFSITRQSTILNGSHPKNTPLVGDLDHDGIPEIVTFNANTYDYFTSIKIFDGSTLALKDSIPLNTNYVSPGWLAPAPAVLVDADGNGMGEIILASISGTVPTMFRYEASLSGGSFHMVPKWGSGITYSVPTGWNYANNTLPQPVVADFNGDSIPELVIYNQIFNAETGALMGITEAIGSAYMGRNPNHINPYTTFLTMADMDGDGLPEIIAGAAVYKVTVSADGTAATCLPLSKNTVIGDGFTAVADLDMDGKLEVVIAKVAASNTVVYVWRPDVVGGGAGSYKSYTITNSAGAASDRHGFPFIGNIDSVVHAGKKYPEICITTVNAVTALKYNPSTDTHSQLWKMLTTDG